MKKFARIAVVSLALGGFGMLTACDNGPSTTTEHDKTTVNPNGSSSSTKTKTTETPNGTTTHTETHSNP